MHRIVLAYSGDLDTSVAIPWLREKHGAVEIITVTMDLGQGRELEETRDRALAAGAARAHDLDLREEFASAFVLPALKADATHEDGYRLATALARPLIAQKLVEVAAIEEAGAVAHGCTAKSNDRVEVAVRALNPALRVIAPARDWSMTRVEELEYAKRHGVRVPASATGPYTADWNLWGRSIECGVSGDPWVEPSEDIYVLTKAAAECPDEPAYVEVRFERGSPTAINGVAMPLVDMIASLSTIAGAHGVGRVDAVEKRTAGVNAREVHEAPAATVLHRAHRELQQLVTDRDVGRFAQVVSAHYADLIDDGSWFGPLRGALDAWVGHVQDRVTGSVRLKLFKGSCRVVGRQSPHAVHDPGPVTDENGVRFDQDVAAV